MRAWSRSTSPHESDSERTAEDDVLHVSQLVLGSSSSPNHNNNSNGTGVETPSKECPPPKVEQREGDPAGSGNKTAEAKVKDDDAPQSKSLNRTLSEQEELERQRAKKIVMDAILSDQSKQALQEVAHGPPANLPAGRLHAGKDVGEVAGRAVANSPQHLRGCAENEKRAKGEETTVVNGDVVANNGGSGQDCDASGVTLREAKREQSGSEGSRMKLESSDPGDAETEVSVSVSSRVKRFSLNDDQMDAAQKHVCPGSPRPVCPGSPRPESATTTPKVVLKRGEPEVQTKRSLLSVTMTTSENNSSDEAKVLANGTELPQRPLTDETENVVWRVRNRRKLKEKAMINGSS